MSSLFPLKTAWELSLPDACGLRYNKLAVAALYPQVLQRSRVATGSASPAPIVICLIFEELRDSMIFSHPSQRLNQQRTSRATDDFFYTILPVAHMDEPGARGRRYAAASSHRIDRDAKLAELDRKIENQRRRRTPRLTRPSRQVVRRSRRAIRNVSATCVAGAKRRTACTWCFAHRSRRSRSRRPCTARS